MLEKFRDIRNKSRKDSLYFQVHLTYHCNLKCKSCSHFSPLSEERELNIDVFENDFKRLSLLGEDKIRKIDLLGGEPLLHSQINDCLFIARKYFRNAEIILITNGLLLPKMPEAFWRACKENKIVLAISPYPIKIDIDKIKQMVKAFDLDFLYDPDAVNKTTFGHFRMDINGTQNAAENVKLCFESKNCHCLDNGKMFLCYLPPCVDIFNRQFEKNIPVVEEDSIDIYKASSISEIIEFLKKPMPFCKYCDVKNRNPINWGVSKKVVEEWT